MKKKDIILFILIFCVLALVLGGTLSYWVIRSDTDKGVVFTTGGIEEHINYNIGQAKFVGDFQPSADHCGGESVTISFSLKSGAEDILVYQKINAAIYIDIKSLGQNVRNSSDVKWALTEGDGSACNQTIYEGTLNGVEDGEIIRLLPEDKNFIVNSNVKTYTVWLWIDSNGTDLDKLSGETIDVNVWTQFDMENIYIQHIDVTASYSCANATVGDEPYTFTYTGDCTVIDDGDGNWRVKFLTTGDFKSSSNTLIDAFLVGGGGGGAAAKEDNYGGGGGGGGYATTAMSILLMDSDTYTITIGAGGSSKGGTGGSTSAFDITVEGGTGGSGQSGGAGGNAGGNGAIGYSGAGSAGSSGSGDTKEFGELDGTQYAGGGGGGAGGTSAGGAGGAGGGGTGGSSSTVQGVAGTANTGGGGGGGTEYYGRGTTGSAGGSGIVVIRNARKISTYTVTYDLNGGSGMIATQTKTHLSNLTLTTVVPTKADADFLGWSTDQNALSPMYLSGGTYTENSDVILYAVWRPTILYLFNAGDQNTNITGGWTLTSGYSTFTITETINGAYFKLSASMGGNATTTKKIDLTHYNTIKVHFTSAEGTQAVVVTKTDYSSRTLIAYRSGSYITVDVSSLQGEYYVGLYNGPQTGEFKADQIWLE